MKKLSRLLLSLLICILFAAPALAETEKEILFRGMEWGGPYGKHIEAFPPDISFVKEESNNEYKPTELLKDYSGNLQSYKNENLGFYISCKNGTLEVAGFPVESVILSYIYKTDENGLLIRDVENACFTDAMYYIDIEHDKLAFEDITEKLTTLYGEPDYEYTYNIIQFYDFKVWYGANGTMVGLQYYSGIMDTSDLTIRYTFKGADNLVEEAHQAVLLEEKQRVESNFEGL